MKWQVELELEDVFGGDGKVRYEPKEQVKLSRTRTRTTIKESLGIAIPVTTQEEIKEKKLEPISTFELDEDGTPLLRLGGAHGKLWGALKASGKQLYQLGDPEFKGAYKAAVEMITVSPTWVRLESDEDLRVEGIPQVLKGAAGGMIVQEFDVVPKVTVDITLTFPDALESKVKKLVDQLELGSHLNKRRTTIKVKSISPI